MKFVSAFISIMIVASQSYAGVPGFIGRGRPSPGAPLITAQQVNVKLLGDMTRFENADAGIAIVDKANDTLKLELYSDGCNSMFPTGNATCLAMPELLATYEVRLESIKDGICGAVVYEGSVNMQPVDGPAYKLVIQDNREFSNHCTAVIAVPETSGSLEVQATRGSLAKELSFEGALLK